MKIISKNSSNIKEIWIASLNLYRKAFTHIWLLGAIAGISMMTPLLKNILEPIININDAFYFLIFLVNICYITYISSLIFLKMYNTASDTDKSWQDIISLVNKKYFKVLINTLIVIILCLLGMTAIVLPGIFILIAVIMTQPLILIDNKGIIGSIKESFKLVWGNWWHTFLVLFPLIFISFWIDFFIQSQNLYILMIALLAAVLYCPFYYSYIIVTFNDLKIRKSKEEKNK